MLAVRVESLASGCCSKSVPNPGSFRILIASFSENVAAGGTSGALEDPAVESLMPYLPLDVASQLRSMDRGPTGLVELAADRGYAVRVRQCPPYYGTKISRI